MSKEEKRKLEKLFMYCISRNEQLSRKKIDLLLTYYGVTNSIIIGVFDDMNMLEQFNIYLKLGDLEQQINSAIEGLENLKC